MSIRITSPRPEHSELSCLAACAGLPHRVRRCNRACNRQVYPSHAKSFLGNLSLRCWHGSAMLEYRPIPKLQSSSTNYLPCRFPIHHEWSEDRRNVTSENSCT